MDSLTFIAEVIKAIAWPITVIIIFMVLRKPLAALFPLLQRLRFQGFEIDFTRQVEALALEVRSQLPPQTSLSADDTEKRKRLTELANLSPRAAVVEAWLEVENAAKEASRRRGLNLKSTEVRSPLVLGSALEEAGILDGNMPGIFHQLRNLRNAAAHASEFAFTPETAIEYIDLALRLSNYLKKA